MLSVRCGRSSDTVPPTRTPANSPTAVNLLGGDVPASIEQITIGLVTRVEIEGGDTEYAGIMEFHRMAVSGPLQLAPKQQLAIPFQLPVPWETPITDVYGQRLHGMTMGLRTELAVARAVDKSDLDQVAVHPLPVHERILDAFQRLGFRFKHADLERGHIYGVQQTLPFYQEIEFFASPQYAQTVNEVELTFVTVSGVDGCSSATARRLPTPGRTASASSTSPRTRPGGCGWSTAGAETVSRFGSAGTLRPARLRTGTARRRHGRSRRALVWPMAWSHDQDAGLLQRRRA
jgi:hypothetical protein